MQSIDTWEAVQESARSSTWAVFYLSVPGCGVCTALKPKVQALADAAGAPAYYVDLERVPEAGGQWSVFSMPGILVFLRGKEIWRGARFIDTREIAGVLERYAEFATAPA